MRGAGWKREGGESYPELLRAGLPSRRRQRARAWEAGMVRVRGEKEARGLGRGRQEGARVEAIYRRGCERQGGRALTRCEKRGVCMCACIHTHTHTHIYIYYIRKVKPGALAVGRLGGRELLGLQQAGVLLRAVGLAADHGVARLSRPARSSLCPRPDGCESEQDHQEKSDQPAGKDLRGRMQYACT